MPDTYTVASEGDGLMRATRLGQWLESKNLDGALLSSFENVAYFGRTYLITQILIPDRFAFLVVRRNGEPAMMVCDIEESLTRHESSVADVRTYVEFAEDPARALVEMLHTLGLQSGRLGVEGRRLPMAAFEVLKSDLPSVTFVSIDDELEHLVMVKNATEIEILRSSAQATQKAIEGAIALTPSGASELELAKDIISGFVRAGGAPIFLVLGSAERSVLSHPFPTDTPIPEASIVRVDGGARFQHGIMSDMARTAVAGHPLTSQVERFEVVRAAQAAIIDSIGPGTPARELFAACKREFARRNLEFAAPHVGHGLGVGLHESPRLHPANETPLEAGMVLNIEPVLFLGEQGEAYHVEDLVLVTDAGHEVLTSPQENLLELGVAASARSTE